MSWWFSPVVILIYVVLEVIGHRFVMKRLSEAFRDGFEAGWTAGGRAAVGLCPCVRCARADSIEAGVCSRARGRSEQERPS